MKPVIQQVIVVEGHHDSERLKKYFDCDTIETGGTSLGDDVIDLIRRTKEKRGVIIFTDPDSPGNRIRNAINQAVPGCENAYVERKKARTEYKVGVEHADEDTLKEALEHLVVCEEDPKGRLTMQDLYELGLSGRDNSAALREKAGSLLHIGNGTAKTMLNRLNCLGITKEELQEVLEK